MNKWFNIVLIIGGSVVLCLGYQAAHSPASVFSHFFRGRPTREVMWMMSAGGVALLAGLVGMLKEK